MSLNRRTLMATGLSAIVWPQLSSASEPGVKAFSGLPPIGMGTWLTFNIDTRGAERQSRLDVLKAFFDAGGGMIDSSPMYTPAEAVLGELLPELDYPTSLVSATKIWTPISDMGPAQMDASFGFWSLPETRPFDLVYVHNLLKWEAHLPMLREAKDRGAVGHIGLTTSHGRRHDDLERLMKTETMDAVQLTYNITHREAEKRLLPAAQDAGLALVINRPMDGGALFRQFEKKPLPDFASEIDVSNWAQYFLKFIISHPAVTCAIPATSNPAHMAENMSAKDGPMPDAAMRKRMIDYVENI